MALLGCGHLHPCILQRALVCGRELLALSGGKSVSLRGLPAAQQSLLLQLCLSLWHGAYPAVSAVHVLLLQTGPRHRNLQLDACLALCPYLQVVGQRLEADLIRFLTLGDAAESVRDVSVRSRRLPLPCRDGR